MNEKVICRQNNWNLNLSDEIEISLVNGLIGYINSPITSEDLKPETNSFYIDFKPEFCSEDYFSHIPVSSLNFQENLTEKQIKYLSYVQWKWYNKFKKKCNKFEFAYAITDYLSQGSEWDIVFIYDEIYGNMRDYYNSLYTQITRAKKKVIIAKQYRKYY
jgi:hypothetical protein